MAGATKLSKTTHVAINLLLFQEKSFIHIINPGGIKSMVQKYDRTASWV